MENAVKNNYRIRNFNNNLIRIDYSKKDSFIEDKTFLAQNEDELVNNFKEEKFEEINGILVYKTLDFEIKVPKSSLFFKNLQILKDNKVIYEFDKLVNSGELPKPWEVENSFVLSDYPKMVLPKNGYRYDVNDPFIVDYDEASIYIFLINKDFKLLKKLYLLATGRTPLIRLNNLGVWNSKYYEYSDVTAKEVITDYEKHDIPLDNLVIDTDWRKIDGNCFLGSGYEINDKLFPDMKGFIKYAHDKKVEIIFNDHPEPRNKKNVFEEEELNYRATNLTNLLELGLDMWWYDRNWSVSVISPVDVINKESFGLYLYEDVTKKYFESLENDKIYRRPVMLGNINNIINGMYIGIEDSASHRYGIQWTGDIEFRESTLKNEIHSMLSAQYDNITYFSSDLGGHIGNPEKLLYLKWIKYGIFSPIFRPHCTKKVKRYREPWTYDEDTVNIFREYARMRYELMAYIYSACYKNYLDGTPLCSLISYYYNNDEAKNYDKEYFFGDNLLIAHKLNFDLNKLSKKDYLTEIKAVFYGNCELSGEPILTTTLDEINFYISNTKLFDKVGPFNFSAVFETTIMLEEDFDLYVGSDDGIRVYVDDKLRIDSWHCRGFTSVDKVPNLKGNKAYKLKIEYFQGLGDGGLILSYISRNKKKSNQIYIPKDNFIDLFKGRIVKGEKVIGYNFKYNELGIYAKLNSALPILYHKNHVRDLDFKNLIFDIYPDINENKNESFLYEDDFETTAYKFNKFNLMKYRTYFDKKSNSFVFEMDANENSLEEYNMNILIKFNLIGKFKEIESVKVDEEEAHFAINEIDENLYPLSDSLSSKICKTLTLKLVKNSKKPTKVHFFLKK